MLADVFYLLVCTFIQFVGFIHMVWALVNCPSHTLLQYFSDINLMTYFTLFSPSL